LVEEIKASELDSQEFISKNIEEIKNVVGDGLAVNALSGGVDSSTVTMLGHRALGSQLKTYFIDHGLMREGEPQHVVELFGTLGVGVELIDARDPFFTALKGVEDPEEKREAITKTFYQDVWQTRERDRCKVSDARDNTHRRRRNRGRNKEAAQYPFPGGHRHRKGVWVPRLGAPHPTEEGRG